MKINTFLASYLRDVVPDGAGDTQIRETKMAFLGGALVAIEAIAQSKNEEEVIEMAISIRKAVADVIDNMKAKDAEQAE